MENSVHEEQKPPIFYANDLDFNGYQPNQLKIICKYELLINTPYPKLVISLFLHSIFQNWLSNNKIYLEEKECIHRIVKAISNICYGLDGSLKCKQINMLDDNIWSCLVEEFLSDKHLQEYEEYSKKNKNITPKKKQKSATRRKNRYITL